MNNDLISRKTALSIVERNAFHEGREWVFRGRIMLELEKATAVDAEPVRHGRWLNKGYITTAYGSIDTGDCSACGAVDVPIEPYDYYCPNCGAKMDGGADDDG